MDPALPSPAPRAMMSHNLVGGWHSGTGCRARALSSPEASAPGAFILAVDHGGGRCNRYGVLAAPPSGDPFDMHAYELVRDDLPIRPFADIEWGVDDFLPRVLDPVDVIRMVWNAGIAVLGDGCTPQIMRASGVLPSGAVKESFHFVWPDRRVSARDLPAFGDALATWLADRCFPGRDIVDMSVYTLPHLMRMLNQTKVGDARTFVAYGDSSSNVADHLIGVYDGSAAPLWTAPAPAQATPTPSFIDVFIFDDTPVFRELVGQCVGLLNVARADDYDEWTRTGMCLYNVGDFMGDADAFLPLWDSFSRRSRKYEAGACERKWRSFGGRVNGLSLGSLRHWAGDDDADGYAPIKREFGRLMYKQLEEEHGPVGTALSGDITEAIENLHIPSTVALATQASPTPSTVARWVGLRDGG